MPNSAARALPAYVLSEYLQCTVSRDGRITSLFGSALERLRELGAEVGTSVWDLCKGNRDHLEVFERLLAGRAVRQVMTAGDSLWMVDARPIVCDGEISGAAGVGFALREDQPAPRRPQILTDVWQSIDDIAREHVLMDDLWFAGGDIVSQVRTWRPEDFAALRKREKSRFIHLHHAADRYPLKLLR